MRVVKAPDVRRAEILGVAEHLFEVKGFSKTSVDEIVRRAGIAKGTFYHYFKSKEEVLDALTQQLVCEMVRHCEAIADRQDLGAVGKLAAIIGVQNELADEKRGVVDSMHLPENRVFHDRINVETVRVFGPVLARVVEQGNEEGVFQVDDPLSTVQFILAGSQFLFGEGVFGWSREEEAARLHAMFVLIERAFAAEPGSIGSALGLCLGREKCDGA